MMFKHYYPLIPISRPIQLTCATACFLVGAYYLYRNSFLSEEEDSTNCEPEESSLDVSDELISVHHDFSELTLFGMFQSYLVVALFGGFFVLFLFWLCLQLHRPHLTSSRLSLLEDEAGVGGAKKKKYNYSSTTSECTTDLSDDKLEDSDAPVDSDESSFGDVVLVLKDDNERHYTDSSDSSDDSHSVSVRNWSPHLLPGEELEDDDDENFEIEYVGFYGR